MQKLYKGIHRQLFACPKTNWWVCFEVQKQTSGMFWYTKNARALYEQFGKGSAGIIPESVILFNCIRCSHWKVFYMTGLVIQVFCREKIRSCSIPMQSWKPPTNNFTKKWDSSMMFFYPFGCNCRTALLKNFICLVISFSVYKLSSVTMVYTIKKLITKKVHYFLLFEAILFGWN